MLQRGRKSARQLALSMVEVPPPQLEPPRTLTKAEKALFTEIAASAPHLRPSDVPLLASYVQATLLSRRSARLASTPGRRRHGCRRRWQPSCV